MAGSLNQRVALLRGINVGGSNVIRMADLRACFEQHGFNNLSTYIQSGNVLFSSAERDQVKLTGHTENFLAEKFRYHSRVVLRSLRQMRAVVERAPKGFGSDPGPFRYDVIFLRNPLEAAEAMNHVTAKAGVDQASAGGGVLYFSRLISRAAQGHLGRIAGLPLYREMTIRNWNTTTTLLRLMEAAAGASGMAGGMPLDSSLP
jgi:uncharacterized protein (DUF1697 family)